MNTNLRRLAFALLLTIACALSIPSPTTAARITEDAAKLELPRADDAAGTTTGAPDYALETLAGGELRLSSLRGKPVLLDFFSATCPHCQRHAPFVVELARRYQPQGLAVVNMAANNQYVDRTVVEEYARKAGITNTIVWAPGELFKLYLLPGEGGFIGVPQAVLFDADGRLVARFDRWENADKPVIEATIAKYIGKGASVPDTATSAGAKPTTSQPIKPAKP